MALIHLAGSPAPASAAQHAFLGQIWDALADLEVDSDGYDSAHAAIAAVDRRLGETDAGHPGAIAAGIALARDLTVIVGKSAESGSAAATAVLLDGVVTGLFATLAERPGAEDRAAARQAMEDKRRFPPPKQ